MAFAQARKKVNQAAVQAFQHFWSTRALDRTMCTTSLTLAQVHPAAWLTAPPESLSAGLAMFSLYKCWTGWAVAACCCRPSQQVQAACCSRHRVFCHTQKHRDKPLHPVPGMLLGVLIDCARAAGLTATPCCTGTPIPPSLNFPNTTAGTSAACRWFALQQACPTPADQP